MLLVREIAGHRDDPRFAGRRMEHVDVAYDEASKRRLRRKTEAGTDIAVDLPAGAYLADGAVLHDDGSRLVVVRRRPEPALVVRLDRCGAGDAVRLGHAFGNQHVPLEVEGNEVRIPLTTSEGVARATVDALGLSGAEIEVAEVVLGRDAPLSVGHGHAS
jgi:urease accessory protein